MDPEPAPRRQWIICGFCGLTTEITSQQVGLKAIEHVKAHATLPPDALPEVPGARC